MTTSIVRSTLPVVAALVIAAACGGTSDGVLSAGEAVHRKAELFCKKAFSCTAEAPTGWQAFYGTTEASCEMRLLSLFGDVNASVKAGRVHYDADSAMTCLDADTAAIDAETCAAFWSSDNTETDPSCANAFVGTVPDGGTCMSALDCVTGLNCVMPASGGYPGTCQASASAAR